MSDRCVQVQERVAAAEPLGDEERAHALECADCRDFRCDAQVLQEAAARLPRPSLSLDRVIAPRGRRFPLGALASAAALVLASIALLVLWPSAPARSPLAAPDAGPATAEVDLLSTLARAERAWESGAPAAVATRFEVSALESDPLSSLQPVRLLVQAARAENARSEQRSPR